MGTYTGQILIGFGHPNHDGIIPNAQMFVSENSRPVLVLVDIPDRSGGEGPIGYVGWIPSLEYPIDDALLMISVYHLAGGSRNIPELDELVQKVNSCLGDIDLRHAAPPELYSFFTPEQRQRLYDLNQKILKENFGGLKLVLTVFDDCLLMHQLPRLKDYGINFEVSLTVYSRLTSMWSPGIHEQGDLERCIEWKRQQRMNRH